MRAIMVMFDSLNRNYLPAYAECVKELPNFQRLEKQTVVFDNFYAGSLPCMPARRELHTGRYNFLHREWGPLEPFDDSMPELLKQNGIYTHLVSDHCHYWEDGGATYHNRYSSWQNVRGQEGDPWIGDIAGKDEGKYLSPAAFPAQVESRRQDQVNRREIKKRSEFPQEETFRLGCDFITRNHDQDNWFLQLETFDPHEPFFVPDRFLDGQDDEGYDWPSYNPVHESDSIVQGIRKRYKGLLKMCDECLGKVIDLMDKYDMWKDTMLIVNTDHGLLVGEKNWWGKNIMPLYNEIVRLPFFVWDPRAKSRHEHRSALCQTIDIAPTLLDFFNVEIPKCMQGKVLKDTILSDKPVREYALYGCFGSHINVTDGTWSYMRAPKDQTNQPLNCYTLAPQNLMGRMSVNLLSKATLADEFSFTKGCHLLKFPVNDFFNMVSPKVRYGNKLLKISDDGLSQKAVVDKNIEIKFINAMISLMKENDAPAEQFDRVGLPLDHEMTMEELERDDIMRAELLIIPNTEEYEWSDQAAWEFKSLIQMVREEIKEDDLIVLLKKQLMENNQTVVEENDILTLAKNILPEGKFHGASFVLKNIGTIE